MASNPDERYQTVGDLQRALRSRRPAFFSAAATVAIIFIVGFVFLSKSCATDVTIQKTDKQEPVVVETPVDTPLIAPAASSEIKENNPAPKKEEDKSERMRKEMTKLIDKAYSATIASFCDSVFPSRTVGNKWAEVSTDFHQRVIKIGDKLTKKYPGISEFVIRQEIESRFQGLVGYVFGRMQENGERQEEEPLH